MDEKEEDEDVFPELTQGRASGHLPSSSNFTALKDVQFSGSSRRSINSWKGNGTLPGSGALPTFAVGEDATSNEDPPHLPVDFPPGFNRKPRVSTQSAWSSNTGRSLGSRSTAESTVWRRDSLFSFGPNQPTKPPANETDGNDSVFGNDGDDQLLIPPKKRVGFVAFTRRFLLDTSGHGLARVVENHISKVRRIVWGLFVIAALTMLIVQTRTLIARYIDFGFKVDVKYNFKKEIGFPAVTLCNLNPLNRTKLSCSRFDTERDDPFSACHLAKSNVTQLSGQAAVQRRLRALLKSAQQFSFDYAFLYNFTQEPLTAAEYNTYGFDLENMLVSCSFRGLACNASNFTKFQSSYYGNCYTFNDQENMQLQTSQPGPAFGLALDLYLDPDEEVGLLAPGTGLRVSLHRPQIQPFPEEDGLSIAPGRATSMGVRQIQIDRLGEPYSNCTNITGGDWEPLYPGKKYSRTTCLRGCLAREMLALCGCVDKEFLVGQRLCLPKHLDETEARCVASVRLAYNRNQLTCDSCTNPCGDKVFRTTVSTATWPSTEYQREFKKLLTARNFYVDNVAADLFREKYARLEVFYEELNYENILQKPAYETENLLADMGGQLGLWIGLSVLAILEFVEYFFYIGLVLLGKVELPVLEGNPDASSSDEKQERDDEMKTTEI